MKIYEDWIKAHLPPEVRGESLDVFGGFQAVDPEKYPRLLRDVMEGNVEGSAVI